MAKKRRKPKAPKRPKEPTLEELRADVRKDVSRWKHVKQRGTTDPFWEDGMNLSLIRNHIIYGREQLRNRCKRDKIKPCPRESKVKLPRSVSYTYCAPKSKAGPCKERRKRTAARKRRKARQKARRRSR